MKELHDELVAKLNEEITLLDMDAHEAKLESLDIEGMLTFAEHLIQNAPRLWTEMHLDRKQRFQKILFPEGLPFSEGNFGTAVTCIFFKMLQDTTAQKSSKASPTGFEPVLLE